MKKLKIGFWKGSIPEKFSELSFEQKVLSLTAQVYLRTEEVSDSLYNNIRKDLAIELCRIPKLVFKLLIAEQKLALYRCLNWVKDIKIEQKPFEFFKVGKVKYYLPAERFADTSAIEYAMSLLLFSSFSNNHKAIYELIATLCRPERADLKQFRGSALWSGDVREEYNTILAQERAKEFEKKLPFGVIVAVKEYYVSMLDGFIKKYEPLFQSADDMKPLFQNGEGCIALLEDIAEANIYGNFEKVCSTNIDTVYLYLRHKKIKAEKEEQDYFRTQNEE